MTGHRPTIRPMTPADVPVARDLFVGAGWQDRSTFFAFALDHPECRAIAAELDGSLVGTGIGTRSGTAGWVGLIFVDPSVRGHGLGTTITEAVCADLEERGCRSLVLMASRLGEPIYRRLGFGVVTDSRIFEPPEGEPTSGRALTPAAPSAGASIRALAAADLPAVEALDWEATGEDRSHLIRAVIGDGGHVVVGRHGEVRAFELDPAWGGHPLVARDPADGYALLSRTAGEADFHRRAVVPSEHTAAIGLLEEHGWRQVHSLNRMVRGEPLPWQPTWLWGNFNFALG